MTVQGGERQRTGLWLGISVACFCFEQLAFAVTFASPTMPRDTVVLAVLYVAIPATLPLLRLKTWEWRKIVGTLLLVYHVGLVWHILSWMLAHPGY